MRVGRTDFANAARRIPRLSFGTAWLLGWLLLAAWLGFGREWLKHNPAQASVQRSPVAPRQESRAARTQPKLESVAISQMRVGDQVPADNPTGEKDTEFGDTVDPPSWRKLVLLASKKDGSFADVELLRPLTWLADQQAETGGTVEVHVPECGIEGRAKVLAIEPCPAIRHNPKFRIVTGTFKHQAAQVLDVYIEGLDEPIGTTPNHPFWSEDRQSFVRADELKEGEHLRAFNGTPIVRRIVPLADPEPVYNLEVQCDHVYHVARNGVLVHNSADDCLRFFHYTDAAGLQGILQTGAIRANQRGLVFLTPDRLSQAQTFTHIFAGNPAYINRGAFVVELRLRPHVQLNPGTQVNELIHNGTLRIDRDFEIIFSGANPF